MQISDQDANKMAQLLVCNAVLQNLDQNNIQKQFGF